MLRKFLTSLPVRFETAKDNAQLHSVIVDVEPETGRATAVKRWVVKQDGNSG